MSKKQQLLDDIKRIDEVLSYLDERVEKKKQKDAKIRKTKTNRNTT